MWSVWLAGSKEEVQATAGRVLAGVGSITRADEAKHKVLVTFVRENETELRQLATGEAALSLQHHCAITAASLHHQCITTAPSLHHHCTR